MPTSIPRLDLKSKSITEEQKEKLRQLFPEVFTEDKIDFEKLQLTLGADVETGKERFGLTWRGKTECFRIIQEPSIGTLKPAKGESVDWDTTENLFIEGDNLETLKLLQKSYYGKIKIREPIDKLRVYINMRAADANRRLLAKGVSYLGA